MRIGLGIDQLGIDADPVSQPADASLRHVPHAQLAADPLCVDPLVLIRELGIARDHEHGFEPTNDLAERYPQLADRIGPDCTEAVGALMWNRS